MTGKTNNIRPEDKLKDVIKRKGAREVFKKYRMACLTCGGFGQEKLIHAAYCHGLDVEELIREITGHKK